MKLPSTWLSIAQRRRAEGMSSELGERWIIAG
jgi:hypothetical protein